MTSAALKRVASSFSLNMSLNLDSLSTGASREAPVDNECFALLCFALLCFARGQYVFCFALLRFALLCFALAFLRRRALLSTGASREASVGNECFALLCSALLRIALHYSGDGRACPQALRAKHLWTMSVLRCFALLCSALRVDNTWFALLCFALLCSVLLWHF